MGYKVIKVDNWMISTWCGGREKFSKYGKPYIFKTYKDAEEFVKLISYVGMSWKYEIKEVKRA